MYWCKYPFFQFRKTEGAVKYSFRVIEEQHEYRQIKGSASKYLVANSLYVTEMLISMQL